MTDLFTLNVFLEDLAPPMELIEGRVFLDRQNKGVAELRSEVARYPSLQEAQRWINAVPIDDFIDLAVPDWSLDDPLLERIVDVYRRSWLALVRSKFGSVEGLSVEVLRDRGAGDLLVRLSQE